MAEKLAFLLTDPLPCRILGHEPGNITDLWRRMGLEGRPGAGLRHFTHAWQSGSLNPDLFLILGDKLSFDSQSSDFLYGDRKLFKDKYYRENDERAVTEGKRAVGAPLKHHISETPRAVFPNLLAVRINPQQLGQGTSSIELFLGAEPSPVESTLVAVRTCWLYLKLRGAQLTRSCEMSWRAESRDMSGNGVTFRFAGNPFDPSWCVSSSDILKPVATDAGFASIEALAPFDRLTIEAWVHLGALDVTAASENIALVRDDPSRKDPAAPALILRVLGVMRKMALALGVDSNGFCRLAFHVIEVRG